MPDTVHKHWYADKFEVWPTNSCVWFALPSVYWALIAPCCHMVTICCLSGEYGQNCHRSVPKGTTKIWFVRKNRRWVSELQFTWGTAWFWFEDILSVSYQFVPVSRVWCNSMVKAPPAETVLGVFRKQNNSSVSYATYSRQADCEVVISLFQGDYDSLYPYAVCMHTCALEEHIWAICMTVSGLHCRCHAMFPNSTSQITLLILASWQGTVLRSSGACSEQSTSH